MSTMGKHAMTVAKGKAEKAVATGRQPTVHGKTVRMERSPPKKNAPANENVPVLAAPQRQPRTEKNGSKSTMPNRMAETKDPRGSAESFGTNKAQRGSPPDTPPLVQDQDQQPRHQSQGPTQHEVAYVGDQFKGK